MRKKRWMTAIALVVGIVGLSLPAVSQERDSDGTRLQARHVDVGTVHNDRLAPPQDEADWRMIQLEDDTNLALKLAVRPSDRSAQLTLTGATGDQLAAKTADEDSATIEMSLDAGIYYIAVESTQSLRYELRID